MAKKLEPEEIFITKEELLDLRKVKKDIFYFSTFINVIHPLKGKVRFDLYPFQKKVLWDFLTKRFNIVLKFRQAGITELISLYCLWLAMYHKNKTITIISIKDSVAKKVLRKIKYMYKNLPRHLRVKIINGRTRDYGTTSEIEFENGSMISSVPTTETAGRSEALSLLVIDEGAIINWASTIWASAQPTLSTGGQAIVNSTPYGIGGWFHQTWVEALAGGNDFNPIRLRWEMHPERDQAWYDTMKRNLGPRRTAQEIDGDFLSSGYSVFDLMDIKAIEDSLSDLSPLEIKYNGSLIIYNRPKKNKSYFIGADIATGRAKDYSTFTIMDREGEEQGCFKGKIPVEKFAKLLYDIGYKYNGALLAPEANDIGLAVVKLLQEWKYPNIYYSTHMIREKGASKPKQVKLPGWTTNSKNRPIIIDELERDISNDLVIIKDPFFVQEAYTFIYNDLNKPIALSKNKNQSNSDDDFDSEYTDDAILGKSITNFVRKGKINNIIVTPE